jgi:hypothetical protein
MTETIAMDIYFIFVAVKLPPPEPETSDIGPVAGGIGGVAVLIVLVVIIIIFIR